LVAAARLSSQRFRRPDATEYGRSGARHAARPFKEVDAMLFLLTNRTRPNLTAAEYGELAALAKEFYASIPADVRIRGEWIAADQSHNYTLLEAPDIETVRGIQAPFERFTETLIVPVNPIAGWTAS
jgi:hypothetical protein